MEVHLAIYDLSNGMARNLSSQFLGSNHKLEMIPHTGLLCFGKEYFFGGGIQAVDPQLFRRSRGIQPCEIQKLGVTTTSRSEFEAWCQSTGRYKFNSDSYDLLDRNCNNFSHEAALHALKLPRGVPEWILEVPQRFLSSPIGQMIRPMLEEMQITQMAPFQARSAHVHFDSSHSSSLTSSPEPSTSSSSPNRSSTTTTAMHTVAHSWPTPRVQTKLPPAMTNSALSTCKNHVPKVLEDFTRPMLSNNTKSIALCIKRLSSRLLTCNDSLAISKLDLVAKSLQGISSGDEKYILADAVTATVESLLHLLTEDTNAPDIPFALLLLRLIVLKYPEDTVDCMEWLFGATLFPDTWKAPMSKSLAWCVASNYLASIPCDMVPSDTTALVDVAIGDWQHDSVQVRQAASTFLYNYALLERKNIHDDMADDVVVSVLCSAMENLTDEKDPITRLRQLVLCGRLVFLDRMNVNEVARELMQDLGFVGILQELTTVENDETLSHGDAKRCHLLSLELIDKFQD